MTILKRSNRLFPYTFDKLFADDFFALSSNKSCSPKFSRKNTPATNIQKTKEGYLVDIIAPGWKKENFQIELNKNILNISTKEEETNNEETETYTRREFRQSSFTKSFTLDLDSLDIEKIAANYQGGILSLSIPNKEKQEEETTKRTIEIN